MIKRTPFVLAGTIAGLAGLLSFRSTPASMTLGTVAAASNAAATPTSAPATSGSTPAGAGSGSGSGSGNTGAATPTTTIAQTTPVGTGVQSATGPLVNYYFGVLSVKVTAAGTKVEKVTIKSLNDGGNPLSQSIDQMSIPQLESQAIAAQNANIQGVSGASYTSAGFKMSLQGALTKLGIK
ncbi:MAG: hypothetical protein KGJ92_06345 [Actinomycetales bacterium]|nr:hypothetical protein [Actinomycetales bacterium]